MGFPVISSTGFRETPSSNPAFPPPPPTDWAKIPAEASPTTVIFAPAAFVTVTLPPVFPDPPDPPTVPT